ncbi:hypothetical protein GCM10022213_02530 [Parerythrobacter jejuensis]
MRRAHGLRVESGRGAGVKTTRVKREASLEKTEVAAGAENFGGYRQFTLQGASMRWHMVQCSENVNRFEELCYPGNRHSRRHPIELTRCGLPADHCRKATITA